ncbi:MAG TPA: amidohydrolase family protein [Phycisphaerae bacterium]|nr:amidohydrolase family protein [Phycisphaerae bacterium]HNU46354.1 amidohydrolase family protein [Phycisphaerae bacterium]
MIVDVHCHLALPQRRVEAAVERFSFEPVGARGWPGHDAYLPPARLRSPQWWFLGTKLGLDMRAGVEQIDAATEAAFWQHVRNCPSVDRMVLLAFDEFHTTEGVALGPVPRRRWPRRAEPGTSMYTSNSLVRHFCRTYPEKLCFGASIHPYRPQALEALEEVARAGAVLVKWLPLTQNIDAADERTQRFLRRAGELGVALLAHYGGEVTLATQNARLEDPGSLLDVLATLHKEGVMPPTIIAHAATPSFPWQRGPYFRRLAAAMAGPLRTAPLYADVAALYYRPWWLRQLLRNPRWSAVRDRLVFGSDFPIPPCSLFFPRTRYGHRAYLREATSWIEGSFRTLHAIGVPDAAFDRGAEALQLGH